MPRSTATARTMTTTKWRPWPSSRSMPPSWNRWRLRGRGIDDAKAASYVKQAAEILYKVNAEFLALSDREACAIKRRRYQAKLANIQAEGPNPIQILGGEDFPQNQTVTIQIENCLFTGYFQGQNFYVSSRSNPYLQAEIDAQGKNSLVDQENAVLPGCGDIPGWKPVTHFSTPAPPVRPASPIWGPVFARRSSRAVRWVPSPASRPPCRFSPPSRSKPPFSRQLGINAAPSTTPAAPQNDGLCPYDVWAVNLSYLPNNIVVDNTPIMRQAWADAGSKVRLYTDASLTYIASITPGTVLAVKAYQTIDGGGP